MKFLPFRYRLASLLVLFASAFSGGHAQSLSDLSYGTETHLDILTWNIEWFPKSDQTADSVAEVIEALDMDVLALQEIDDSVLCRSMISSLGGYELYMDDSWFGGLAFVYKASTIQALDFYKIYDDAPYWNIFPRSPLVMEFEYGGKGFVAINNHYKCCGDGDLDLGNLGDEEFRRFRANELLKEYIDDSLSGRNVILLGDLNDDLVDLVSHNVFQMFLDDPSYLFADIGIAAGPLSSWSYPSWPSHLDHILINNDLISVFALPQSHVETVRIDDFMPNGWSDYDATISDHRPVALSLFYDELSSSSTITLPELSIYPNPSRGSFSLKLAGDYRNGKIEIYDVAGSLIHELVFDSQQQVEIRLDAEPGVYYLILKTDRQHYKKLLQIY